MDLFTRFEDKFIPEPNSGCWLWTASLARGGYGQFYINGGPEKAHRVAYMLYVDDIPEGLHVCHKCDVPSCVNPAHLFLGTNADNVADRVAKGRTRAGEDSGTCKLSNDLIMAIRSDYLCGIKQCELADKYGVSRSHINNIVHSKQRITI